MAHLPGGPSIRGKLSAAAPRIALLAIQHAGAPPALSDRTAHIQLHPLQSYTAVRGPPSAGESRPESSSKKQKGTCAAAMPRRRGRPEGESTEVLPLTNTLRRGHDEDLRSHRDDSTLQQDFMGFIIPWPSPAQRQAEKGPRSARAGTSALRRLPFFHKITTPHHESCWLRPLSRLWLISWPLARGRALAIIILGATNCIYCLHSIYHSIYQIILSLFISLLRRRPRLFFRALIDETPTFRVGSVSV